MTHDTTQSPCPGCGSVGLVRRETGWAFAIDIQQAREANHRARNHTCRSLELLQERDEARAVLREVEWNGGPMSDHCPWCREVNGNGHDFECELFKVINSVG